MEEQYGDLWEIGRWADAIVITTNGVQVNGRAVMGKGCALEAAERYPQLPLLLGSLLSVRGNHCYVLHAGPPAIVSFPTKDQWRAPAKTHLIHRSARELVALANQHGWRAVVLPRPGCGAGGLHWENNVRPIVAPFLDARFVVVTKQYDAVAGPSSGGRFRDASAGEIHS